MKILTIIIVLMSITTGLQADYNEIEIKRIMKHATYTMCKKVLEMDEKQAGEIIIMAGLMQTPKIKYEGDKLQKFVDEQVALCRQFPTENFYDLISYQ